MWDMKTAGKKTKKVHWQINKSYLLVCAKTKQEFFSGFWKKLESDVYVMGSMSIYKFRLKPNDSRFNQKSTISTTYLCFLLMCRRVWDSWYFVKEINKYLQSKTSLAASLASSATKYTFHQKSMKHSLDFTDVSASLKF